MCTFHFVYKPQFNNSNFYVFKFNLMLFNYTENEIIHKLHLSNKYMCGKCMCVHLKQSGHWSMCGMVRAIQLTLMNFLQLLKLTWSFLDSLTFLYAKVTIHSSPYSPMHGLLLHIIHYAFTHPHTHNDLFIWYRLIAKMLNMHAIMSTTLNTKTHMNALQCNVHMYYLHVHQEQYKLLCGTCNTQSEWKVPKDLAE